MGGEGCVRVGFRVCVKEEEEAREGGGEVDGWAAVDIVGSEGSRCRNVVPKLVEGDVC